MGVRPSFNPTLFVEYISGHKKLLGKAVIVSVDCYGCEVRLLKTEEQRKLLALQIDYLRRSARVSRLQKIPNTAIRNKMQAEQSMLDRIQRRQLK